MELDAARLIYSYRRPHELEIDEYYRIRGGHRHGKTVAALKGPPWPLPHALAGLLFDGSEEERRIAADAVREIGTEILAFDIIWY